jgi:acetyltransferase-like isoleucine patch superfamily enzyme
MSFLSHFCALVKRGFRELQLLTYDSWTIAAFFRKEGAQIGDNCTIMVRSLGTEPYLVRIGNHVGIAGGVIFATHEGAARILRQEIPDLQVFGPIIIEDNCIIGQNAFLCPNIRIGKNSIIGANSVVTSDIPPDKIAMGIPARVMGSTDRFKEKCIAAWQLQKPPGIKEEEGKDFYHSKYYKKNRELLKEHLKSLYWAEGSIEKRDIADKP